jgi:hypothetical protein
MHGLRTRYTLRYETNWPRARCRSTASLTLGFDHDPPYRGTQVDHPPAGRTPRIGGSHGNNDRRGPSTGSPAGEVSEIGIKRFGAHQSTQWIESGSDVHFRMRVDAPGHLGCSFYDGYGHPFLP